MPGTFPLGKVPAEKRSYQATPLARSRRLPTDFRSDYRRGGARSQGGSRACASCWQIELFFKALKQNLKVNTFVGTTPNALKIQIWTALISMRLLKYLQLRSRLNWHLSNLVALLRWNLFTYRDLWDWIDNPFETPPLIPKPVQLKLRL